MQKMKLLLLIASFLGFLASCEKETALCEDAANSDSADCKISKDLGINTSLLEVKFTDSKFFNANENEWEVASKSDFDAGSLTETVPLYTGTVSKTSSEAIASATLADSQYTSGSSTKNDIPYLRIEAKNGVSYEFSYKKYDTIGTLKFEKVGQLIKSGDYAYIPLVNEFFDNQLYSTGTSVGTTHRHVFSIVATSATKTGLAKIISLNTIASIQNADYLTEYGVDATAFTLDNRWFNYKKAPSYSANTNMSFVKLSDKSSSGEGTDLDVRVVFKDNLKLEIEQVVFEEMPFQFENFKTTGNVVQNRGYSFYTNTVTLNSNDDFGHKVYLGNTDSGDILMSQISLKEYKTTSFPAGKKFNISLNFDFTPTASYTSSADPNSKGLLYPLRPVCNQNSGTSYEPWVTEALRASTNLSGNYMAVCHLDLSTQATIDPNNNVANTALSDTWFNFFSYAPLRSEKKELGHFYGIKQIKLKASGCYKVQVKAVGSSDSTYQNRTTGTSNCGDSGSTSDWSAFTAEKTYTIFDNESSYGTTLGLSSLLSVLKSSTLIQKNNLLFNNERLNGNQIRHLY